MNGNRMYLLLPQWKQYFLQFNLKMQFSYQFVIAFLPKWLRLNMKCAVPNLMYGTCTYNFQLN